jgi:hypothetical protein
LRDIKQKFYESYEVSFLHIGGADELYADIAGLPRLNLIHVLYILYMAFDSLWTHRGPEPGN